MSKPDIDTETLNACVDGELDGERAADVLAAAAADPAIVRELSALSRLKTTLAASIEAPALTLQTPARARRLPRVASAVVGGYLRMTGSEDGSDAPRLAAAHGSWSIEAAPLRASSISPDACVPDLSSARRSIVHVGRHDMAGDGRALVVGYRGARGCKLSLIVLPGAEGSETGLTPIAAQDVAGFVWRAGRLGYAILAQGMADARLRVIANKVMEASRRRLPLDKAARTRLAESRAKSAPCRV